MSTLNRVMRAVQEWLPQVRNQMSRVETELAPHLRGNEKLMVALTNMISERIAGRVKIPEPTDPLVCKSMLARDRELQWLLTRLEFIYRSPVDIPGSDAEQP